MFFVLKRNKLGVNSRDIVGAFRFRGIARKPSVAFDVYVVHFSWIIAIDTLVTRNLSSDKMLRFDAIAAAVILIIRLHIIYANRFINCANVFERSNAYINGYAWYECDNFGHCIICNSPYSPMRGSYISRDALTAFGSRRGAGGFCGNVYGSIRRRVKGRMFSC
uniref:Uncharacterized protein n=1 Tax=Romanomermis culicivorax TaxID=13658 RepID=A0A915HRE8_ROMCU